MLAARTLRASLVLLPFAAAGQTLPELPRVTGAVETALVEIDVFVTDRDGNPVRGLQPADFEVRIGGRPVEIAALSETPSASPPSESPRDASEPVLGPAEGPPARLAPETRPARHVVLFLDRLELPDKIDARGTFDALRALVAGALGPPDDAMIVLWDRGLHTLVPFTSDRAVLDRALEAEMRRTWRPSEDEATRDRILDELVGGPQPLSGRSPMVDSGGRDFTRRAAAAEAYARIRAKAAALEALIATLGGLRGRRVLVFASQRFSALAGLEFFLDPRGGPDLPADARELDTRAIVESVAESANANGVTLYPFFPTGYSGGRMFPVSAADRPSSRPKLQAGVMGADAGQRVMNETAALGPLAEQTGGSLAVGAREARAAVPRILGDLDHSYVLAVAAPDRQGGRGVSVSVRTKDRRLVVRSRRSLVVKSVEERVRDRVLSNLLRPDGASRIALGLAGEARVETAAGKRVVTVPVRIPLGGLAAVPSARGRTVRVTVLVAVSCGDGSFSEVLSQKKAVEIPRKDLERARRGAFTYRLPVAIGRGACRISVGVLDDVGQDAGFLLLEVGRDDAALLLSG